MNLHKPNIPLNLSATGYFSWCLFLLTPLFGAQALKAEIFEVPDGKSVFHDVAADPETLRAGSSIKTRDLDIHTGREAQSNLRFPCGMTWIVQEQSRVSLQNYVYDGIPVRNEAIRVAPEGDSLQRLAQSTGVTKGVTTWSAKLEEGTLEFAGLHSQSRSRQTLSTPEAEFNLHLLAGTIHRDAENGTVIEVVAGQIDVTLKDGSHLTLGDGFHLSISPTGAVKMDRRTVKTWVLVPAPAAAPEAGEARPASVTMPERPEDVLFVSVS